MVVKYNTVMNTMKLPAYKTLKKRILKINIYLNLNQSFLKSREDTIKTDKFEFLKVIDMKLIDIIDYSCNSFRHCFCRIFN